MSGFQTAASYNPAPGVEGDFATTNPRASVLAGPGGLVAGDAGVTVGRFAWLSAEYVDGDNAPAVANNHGSGVVAGFVHREQQGLITQYLEEYSMLVPAGFQVTLMKEGDFWVRNSGAAAVTPGMKAYADLATGKVTFAATDAATAAAFTAAVTATTFEVTASVAGNVMSVTAVASGTVVAGATVSGTGVASGTKIVEQLSGTAGGVGTYAVDIPAQDVASTTVSGTYGTMTVSAISSGTIVPGMVISGTGVDAGTTVAQLLTGAGGTGTYVVDSNTAVSSTAIAADTNVETKWTAFSYAAAGELVKISSWPQG